jgi:hypothetical protein
MIRVRPLAAVPGPHAASSRGHQATRYHDQSRLCRRTPAADVDHEVMALPNQFERGNNFVINLNEAPATGSAGARVCRGL